MNADDAFERLRRVELRERSFVAPRRGRIGALVSSSRRVGAIAELACATDFASSSVEVVAWLDAVLAAIVEHAPADRDALLARVDAHSGRTFGVELDELARASGEPLELARFARLAPAGLVGSYVHHDAQIGALVAVETTTSAELATPFLELLPMHVCATRALVLSGDDVPLDVLARETARLIEELDLQGEHPQVRGHVLAKYLEPFRASHALLEQRWTIDESLTVRQAVERALGRGSTVVAFERYQVGR